MRVSFLFEHYSSWIDHVIPSSCNLKIGSALCPVTHDDFSLQGSAVALSVACNCRVLKIYARKSNKQPEHQVWPQKFSKEKFLSDQASSFLLSMVRLLAEFHVLTRPRIILETLVKNPFHRFQSLSFFFLLTIILGLYNFTTSHLFWYIENSRKYILYRSIRNSLRVKATWFSRKTPGNYGL